MRRCTAAPTWALPPECGGEFWAGRCGHLGSRQVSPRSEGAAPLPTCRTPVIVRLRRPFGQSRQASRPGLSAGLRLSVPGASGDGG